MPAFHEHALSLVAALSGQGTVDAHEWFVKVTFDIVAEQTFGFDAGCVPRFEESQSGRNYVEVCRASGGMQA